MNLYPASANTGIIFKRIDINKKFVVNALNVIHTPLCTVLDNNGDTLSTTEHFMAALASLGIDNIYIEIDGPELPILDGSSMPFLIILDKAEVKELNAAKKFIKVKKAVQYKEDDKWAQIIPFDGFKVSFEIDFEHPIIKSSNQNMTFNLTAQNFRKELSKARTFGFMKDIEFLHAHNLALGGNTDNAILLDKYRVINPDGLRYEDEFIRHKVLDSIGDLYMEGYQLLGAFSAYKSGHSLNNKLLSKLMRDKSAWEIITFDNKKISLNEQCNFDSGLIPTG
jgi:UDP-3-O-[3-hydroxymyristoyl] N-acetylglucosamine deacetylase